MIGRRIGRYRIIARLGQGGLATVWKAHDDLLGRDVALKVLHEHAAASPKARRRFLHDAQAAAALDHPGIVAVYDTGEVDGHTYIALSLIDGETVSERAAARLMPFDEAVRIVRDAAEALGHAHERGVIHRDVTGRNIMVAHDGRVFVLDFGLALAAWESRVTTTEAAMGTALYMSPEVIQAREADARSDLYGLGVVLYEALTGSFPFAADQPQAVFYSATNLAPVPPRARRPEIPPALEQVVLRAIARDPMERYQTAAEFAAALRGVDLSGTPSGDGTSSEPRKADAGSSAGSAKSDPAGAGFVGADPVFLAVLPFEAVASAEDPEGACSALASRLSETLSAAMARSAAVRVVPPPTGDLPAEPREVARRLGANTLLRGSVRRAGSQVRVSYTLVDPWRGVQLGGDVVDGSAFHVFDVEDQVVASVSRALGLELGSAGSRVTRPPDPVAHDRYLQALGYLKRYDNEASVDGAIHLLERLVESQPDVASFHAALARAYLHKQQRTKQRVWEGRAAAACERALKLDAGLPEVRTTLGELLLRSGQHDAAIAAFSEALRLQPECFEAALGVSRAHVAAGRFDEAERTCLTAVAMQPSDWRGHIGLGRVYFQRGEFDRAIGPWRRVIELTPDNALGRRHLGSAFYRLDRFEEAVSAYHESLSIQPNDEAYGNLGTALYFLARYDEALAALRKATELSPADPMRWGNLGNACHWLPDHEREAGPTLERAIALMRERLERDPSRAEWWAHLAGWLANLNQRAEAKAAIERAVALAPKDVYCMELAGRVYFQLGDRDTCLHWFREARRAGFRTGELLRSRELAPLREDPEFIRILGEAPEATPSAQGKAAPRAPARGAARRASGTVRQPARKKGPVTSPPPREERGR